MWKSFPEDQNGQLDSVPIWREAMSYTAIDNADEVRGIQGTSWNLLKNCPCKINNVISFPLNFYPFDLRT